MSDPGEPQRRRRRAAPPPPPAGSAVKGAALVAVAVLVGFLLLRDDGSTSVATGGPGGSVTTQPGGDEGDGEDTSTTSSTVALRPNGEVKVLVANGTSVGGAAKVTTDQLKAAGYTTGTPTNHPNVTATIVYFVAGYDPEAAALATTLGVAATAVTPIPAVAPVADLQGAHILVVIGPDIAQAG